MLVVRGFKEQIRPCSMRSSWLQLLRSCLPGSFVATTLGLASVCPAGVSTIDLTSGVGGTTLEPSAFNETRAVEVEVLDDSNLEVTAMTLSRFHIAPGPALRRFVGARIYDSSSNASLAAVDIDVDIGDGQSVTLPISATLLAGGRYRIAFYLAANFHALGDFFAPDPPLPTVPYTEASGRLRIHGAYQSAADEFPVAASFVMPYMSIQLAVAPALGVELAAPYSFAAANQDAAAGREPLILAGGAVGDSTPAALTDGRLYWGKLNSAVDSGRAFIPQDGTVLEIAFDPTVHPEGLAVSEVRLITGSDDTAAGQRFLLEARTVQGSVEPLAYVDAPGPRDGELKTTIRMEDGGLLACAVAALRFTFHDVEGKSAVYREIDVFEPTSDPGCSVGTPSDTTCNLELVVPDGLPSDNELEPGLYRVKVHASDESGDEIFYDFGGGKTPLNEHSIAVEVGWVPTISVDDNRCLDGGATCNRTTHDVPPPMIGSCLPEWTPGTNYLSAASPVRVEIEATPQINTFALTDGRGREGDGVVFETETIVDLHFDTKPNGSGYNIFCIHVIADTALEDARTAFDVRFKRVGDNNLFPAPFASVRESEQDSQICTGLHFESEWRSWMLSQVDQLRLVFPAQPGMIYREIDILGGYSTVPFLRADVDQNGTIDITDSIVSLRYQFGGERPQGISCMKAFDTNDDGSIDIADPLFGLFYAFLHNVTIPAPHGVCGMDPTPGWPSDLSCSDYPCSR